MKAEVFSQAETMLAVVAYEKGDGPATVVDLPPAIINRFQRARLELDSAEDEVMAHLHETGQR